jgi:hypothetical protein
MKTILIALLLFARMAFCALSTTVVWEVRPTNGLDTNGGGFDPGVVSPGTDFSQQNSTQVSYTDLVVGATTTQVTSVLNPFGATYPGNLIHIASGSGCTTGWFEVLSVSGITATLDRSAGTAASICTGSLGGALQTLAQLNTNMSLDQQAWAKAESTLSSGRINWSVSGGTGFAAIQGYTTTRGDGGYFTTVINVNDYFWVMTQSGNLTFKNYILDHNNQGGGNVVLFGGCCTTLFNISAINTGGTSAFNLTAGDRSSCSFCYASGVTGASNAFIVDGGILCYVCVASGNTLTALVFNLSMTGGGQPGGVCIRCIAANNTSSSAAFGSSAANQAPFYLLNSIAVNNGGDAVALSNHSFPSFVINNVFVSNSGFGINSTSVMPPGANVVMNNSFFGNTSGARNNISVEPGDVTLSGNPFTNSAGNNFSLNAGAGAALYGAGLPGALTIGGTGFLDIGALQHQAAAASSPSGSPITQ